MALNYHSSFTLAGEDFLVEFLCILFLTVLSSVAFDVGSRIVKERCADIK